MTKNLKFPVEKKKEHIDLELLYFILTVLQPFVLITAFYFNSCQLEHYMYIPSLITYFSTPKQHIPTFFQSENISEVGKAAVKHFDEE